MMCYESVTKSSCKAAELFLGLCATSTRVCTERGFRLLGSSVIRSLRHTDSRPAAALVEAGPAVQFSSQPAGTCGPDGPPAFTF